MQRLLVVNAASQGETIEDVLVAYRAASCAGVVLSKLDEAIKLGPALDAAIRHKLTVVGVANGQRVPEDWHRLSANALVQRAMRGGGSAAWRLDAAEMNLVFATPSGRRRRRAQRLIAPLPRFARLDPMPTPSRHDQAAGLRQMFAGACARFVPVVSNPHVACGGVMLERLSTAFAERGARVLVVDAGERAGAAGEMAMVDLGQCVERLSPQVSYLAARGLAIRFVDAGGSTRSFLERAAEAAPGCDVVIVHAARERAVPHVRARRAAPTSALAGADLPCPIVVADDRPPSVTHAYASMKLLARAPAWSSASCCSAPRRSRRAPSGSPPSSPPAPTTSSPACCATGPGSTRPATRATPPAATCAVSSPRASRTMPRSARARRPAARHALAGAIQ